MGMIPSYWILLGLAMAIPLCMLAALYSVTWRDRERMRLRRQAEQTIAICRRERLLARRRAVAQRRIDRRLDELTNHGWARLERACREQDGQRAA